MNKRRIIIEGRPVAAVTVGCPAYIQQSNGILRTSPIVGIGSLSPYELQFETQNTRYTLNILTADELCRPNGGQSA